MKRFFESEYKSFPHPRKRARCLEDEEEEEGEKEEDAAPACSATERLC